MGRISKQEKEGKAAAGFGVGGGGGGPELDHDPTISTQMDKFTAISAHLNSSLTLRHLIDASTCRPLAKCDSSKILPKTTYSKCYLNSPLETHLIVLGLMRDRAYQLFVSEQSRMFAGDVSRAKSIMRMPVKEYPGANASLEQVMAAMMADLSASYNKLYMICAQLPGLYF
jgi:hypothetical protein